MTARGRGFEGAVIDLARRLGWMVAHWSDSRKIVRTRAGQYMAVGDRNAKGFPDLILAHPGQGRFLVRECKEGSGRLSVEQREWIAALTASGVDVAVWRPEDWPLIENTLKGGAAPAGGGQLRGVVAAPARGPARSPNTTEVAA